ncbi:hypothetical protein [Nocardia sp. NPDC057455]|uniref:hypothetical protein n=1 Tax=Nocardia sp. NPDC057455 TaxID=3346138 RepID=UPI00367322BA
MVFGPEVRSITAGVNVLRLLGVIRAGGGLSLTRADDGWSGALVIDDGDHPIESGELPTIDEVLADLRSKAIG